MVWITTFLQVKIILLSMFFNWSMELYGTNFSTTFCSLKKVKVALNPSEVVTIILFESGSVFLQMKNTTSTKNLLQRFCFYQGHVNDNEISLATLNSERDILRGNIKYKDKLYILYPQKVSSPILFADMLPTDKKILSNLFNNNNTNASNTRMKRDLQLTTIGYQSNPHYLQLFLVADKTFVDNAGGKAAAEVRLLEIGNNINALYRPLNIHIILVGFEVWYTGDRMSVVNNSTQTLNNFQDYRMNNLTIIIHDSAHFITGKRFSDNVLGLSCYGGICHYKSSVGVNCDNSKAAMSVSITVAHEMGHNLGLHHDNDDPTCLCPDPQGCIMIATSGLTLPTKWSSCSQSAFNKLMATPFSICLHDIPSISYIATKTCGNGVIDVDEDCDCGTYQNCADDICCNPSTCKFKNPLYKCSSGDCCNSNTCQFKVQGTICRTSNDDCQLEEYCSGISSVCPTDVFKANGEGCSVKSEPAYCYNGKCSTHSSQCQAIYNANSYKAADICYTYENVNTGYCNFKAISAHYFGVVYQYEKCKKEHLFCGLLHCDGYKFNDPMNWPYWEQSNMNTLTYTVGETVTVYNCFNGLHNINFTGLRQPGLVPNGAKCGNGKMCIESVCTDVSLVLNTKVCSSAINCSGRGVCNSLGQCHCNKGWSPPDCSSSGCGGSVYTKSSCTNSESDIQSSTTNTITITNGSRQKNFHVTFSIIGDFDKIIGNNKSDFLIFIRNQLTIIMQISSSQIVNLDCYPGSIIVAFDISDVTAVVRLENAINSNNNQLSINFNNNLLTIKSGSLNYANSNTTDATTMSTPPNGGNNILYIVLGCVGGIFILILIILGVFCFKKSKSTARPRKPDIPNATHHGKPYTVTLDGRTNNAFYSSRGEYF